MRRLTIARLLGVLIFLRSVVEIYSWHYASALASGKTPQLGPLLDALPQAMEFVIAGVIAYRLLGAPDRIAQRARVRAFLGSGWGAVTACLAAATYLRMEAPAMTVLVLAAIALALAASPLAAPLESIGRVSYFIYFAHFISIDALAHVLRRPGIHSGLAAAHLLSREGLFVLWLCMVIAVTGAAYLLARVSMRTFEGPINRWAHQQTRDPAVAVVVGT